MLDIFAKKIFNPSIFKPLINGSYQGGMLKIINTFFHWFEVNSNLAYPLIRIFLGAALFVRGWFLFADPGALTELARADQEYWYFSYITMSHLIGGFCLTIGFLTRLAAFIQMPILVGAVFVVHLEQGLMQTGQSL
jgi:uncharacterized membrane protein YphA (DoxX/SURF4 family)